MTQIDFYTLLPAIVLTVWACALLLVDVFTPGAHKGRTAFLAALGLALTLGATIFQPGSELTGFNGMVVRDGFANFLTILLVLTGLLSVAVAYGYTRRMGIDRGEYYSLMLFSIVGMMLMAQAADLLVVFIALEMLSIPLYVLTAFAYPKAESEEAGLKYFLLGAFSTGFVVYGIALTFGAAGTTNIAGILAALVAGSANSALLLAGAALILVGLSFKTALVPFHMWTPDVYQGAPTSVTAFMAAGAKVAGFAALVRVFASAFPALAADLQPIFWTLAALTMILGNLVAITQSDIKRMLSYSSIAQAGYILMAFVGFGGASQPAGVAAVLFYLVAYTVASFGAWGVVIALEKESGHGLKIADYAGLGKKSPALAAAMTVFMLSFAGLPPTIGLVGKLYLFRATLEGGFYGLALIGVITSLISAFYYLRVVMTMYMQDGQPEIEHETWLTFTIAFSALATVVISLFPATLFDWASRAVLMAVK